MSKALISDSYTQEAYTAYVAACRELDHEPKTMAEWNGTAKAKRSLSVPKPIKWVGNKLDSWGACITIAVVLFLALMIIPEWHTHHFAMMLFPSLGYLALVTMLMTYIGNRRWDWDDRDNEEWKIGSNVGIFFLGIIALTAFMTQRSITKENALVESYFEGTSCKLHDLNMDYNRIKFFDERENGLYELSVFEKPTRSGRNNSLVVDSGGHLKQDGRYQLEDALAEVCN